MPGDDHLMYIGGAWVGSDSGVSMTATSPATGRDVRIPEDPRRGLRFAEAARAGWVNVNEGSNYWESHLPFGGRAGSKSGVGRVGGRHAMDAFTELKTVVLNLG